MRILSRPALLASVGILAIGSPVLAQDDAVFVLGDITLSVDDVSGYVASGAQATKSATPIGEAQQSISVVTGQQIADQGAQNLGQALSYTSGVLGQPYGADPRFDSPMLRGFSAERAQYVNGLRQGRFFGSVAYETYGMQQVEVLRGPSSSLYGSGSPAGVINQVQKRARSHDFGEAGIGYDSNDSRQLFFDVNRAASDTLAWRLTGISRDDQTQIDGLTNDRGYLAGALRWSPDVATTIDFLASYTRESPISPTGVPLDLATDGSADHDRLRDLYTGQRNWDDSDRRMWNIGVEFSRDLDNGWRLSQGFRYESMDWDYDGTYVQFGATTDADGNFDRGSSRQIEESDSLSLDTRLSGEVIAGAITHQLLFGVDARKYDATESSQFGTATSFNWRNPQYDEPAPTFFGDPNAGQVMLRQVGIYAQDEIVAGNWRGSLGLRYDWMDQSGAQYGNSAAFEDTALTGRAGIAHVFDNGMMPYLSYATSFDPQPGIDIDGDALKPTRGKQWEAGVKYSPTAFDGLITAAIYDLRQTDLNRNVIIELPDGSTRTGYRQIGEVKSRGLELEATAEIAEGWNLRAGYAYNETEQVAPAGDVLNGKEMANAPRHLASLWLDRDFGNGLRLGGGLRHIGGRFGDEANTKPLDSVTLLDLGASYRTGNVEASLNITNLADKNYVATCSFLACFYGEGRTVSARVAYTW